jgi:molybdenum cofactor biosynthesis protein MoaC
MEVDTPMMRDISKKRKTLRTAIAEAEVLAAPATLQAIRDGAVPKGDPLEISKAVAAQAAKQTSQWIPYCHPIAIDFVGVRYELLADRVKIVVQVKAIDRTGVEVEAMTAAAAAALNLYDMLKMIDATLSIGGIRLIEKTGGKSDFADAFVNPPSAAVLVLSDSIAAGKNRDASGKLIAGRLEAEGLRIVDFTVIPDDQDRIAAHLRLLADETKVDLIVSTGGTGLGPRDRTPEAVAQISDREVPGIAEAMRNYGFERTPYAMLSRGMAAMRGNTLILCLPGSSRGVEESLDGLFPGLLHALKMIRARGRSH